VLFFHVPSGGNGGAVTLLELNFATSDDTLPDALKTVARGAGSGVRGSCGGVLPDFASDAFANNGCALTGDVGVVRLAFRRGSGCDDDDDDDDAGGGADGGGGCGVEGGEVGGGGLRGDNGLILRATVGGTSAGAPDEDCASGDVTCGT
jgi:hypothetical protein